MADWGNIPNEIATKIAEHIELWEDLEMFKYVCTSWNLAAKQAKFQGNSKSSTLTRVPWLMLPETDDTSNQRRIYSLDNNKVRRVSLPMSNSHEKRLLSSHGWILSVTEKGKNLCLFNPTSDATINLPPVMIMKNTGLGCYIYETHCFQKVILSGNPSTTSDFAIALILIEPSVKLSTQDEIIFFWRKDDHEWTPLEEDSYDTRIFYSDITFYQGKFYGVSDYRSIFCFEFHHSDHPRTLKVRYADFTSCSYDDDGPYTLAGSLPRTLLGKRPIYYLVESYDRLLLVCRVRRLVDSLYRTTSFEVFEINVENGVAEQVHDLEDIAIFVGLNSSFSAKVSIVHGCKPNSIYFTDENRMKRFDHPNSKGKDMGINCLADKYIGCYYDGSSHYGEFARFMWLEAPRL